MHFERSDVSIAPPKIGNQFINNNDGTVYIILHRRKDENLKTLIDKDDLERVLTFPYTWYASYKPCIKGYYATAMDHRIHRQVTLHQFIANSHEDVVDHINGDSLDNRKSNLRVVPHEANSMNRKSKNRNNKSGYRNVCKIGNQWIVQIQINGRTTKVGTFPLDKLEEAGKFAEEMREKYYGEYAGAS